MIGIVLDQLPIIPIPQTQFATSSCREQVAIRTPGKMFYPGSATWEFETLLTALGVPESDLSMSRGIPTRLVGIIFLVIVALAVSAATQVIGVLLIFSLLVTPAAIAERLSTHPPMVILLSVLLAVIFTWVGLLIAFYFPYPVSFFITSFAFLAYIIIRVLLVTQEGTITLAFRTRRV